MQRVKSFAKAFSIVPAGLLVAAAAPTLFATVTPGLWEITRPDSEAVRLCVSSPPELAQFQDRNARCSRTVIRDDGSQATVQYSCPGGDFGRSDVTLITPRALSISTQGISGGAPFRYTLQAHRIGDCPQ